MKALGYVRALDPEDGAEQETELREWALIEGVELLDVLHDTVTHPLTHYGATEDGTPVYVEDPTQEVAQACSDGLSQALKRISEGEAGKLAVVALDVLGGVAAQEYLIAEMYALEATLVTVQRPRWSADPEDAGTLTFDAARASIRLLLRGFIEWEDELGTAGYTAWEHRKARLNALLPTRVDEDP